MIREATDDEVKILFPADPRSKGFVAERNGVIFGYAAYIALPEIFYGHDLYVTGDVTVTSRCSD